MPSCFSMIELVDSIASPERDGMDSEMPFNKQRDEESEESNGEIESSSSSESVEPVVPFEFESSTLEHSSIPLVVASFLHARWLLCASQFCYFFSEIAWEFGTSIWLAQLGGDDSSMFWVSAYQAMARILILVLVPKLSSEIDKKNQTQTKNNITTTTKTSSNRSRLLAKWIIGQHSLVLVTILLIMATLKLQSKSDEVNSQDTQETSNFYSLANTSRVLVCLCGGLAQVLHEVLQVAIERDWLVVLAEEAKKEQRSDCNDDNNGWLKITNVRLRQIYLSCEILGPLLMGFLLQLQGNDALWIIFGLKGASMILVWFSMRTLCRWFPALQNNNNNDSRLHNAVINNNGNTNDEDRIVRDSFCDEEDLDETTTSQSGGFCSELRLYFAQEGLVGAGLALVFLYGNLLTLGPMMVAYLAEIGGGTSAAASIGVWKALSNVMAIAGTFWFSWSSLKLHTKGLVSLTIMVVCLTVSMVGIWMGRSALSSGSSSYASLSNIGSILVIAGVVPSRFGLWGYDLSVMQLYQTHVEAPMRGRVGGTQTVLNNAMEFLPIILGMTLLSKVSDFWILMIMGYSCVGIALIVYFVGTYQRPPTEKTSYGRVIQKDHSES